MRQPTSATADATPSLAIIRQRAALFHGLADPNNPRGRNQHKSGWYHPNTQIGMDLGNNEGFTPGCCHWIPGTPYLILDAEVMDLITFLLWPEVYYRQWMLNCNYRNRADFSGNRDIGTWSVSAPLSRRLELFI